MKKYVIIILVVALAVGGYLGFREYQRVQAAKVTNYQTVKAARGDLTAIVGATGTVRANQTAILTWQTTGTIANVNVKEGDQVQKGQEIASIDPATLPQNIILAQSDLVTAQRNLDTLTSSLTAQANAQLALTQAKDAYDKANTHREGLKYPRASQINIDDAYSKYQLALANVATAQDAWNKAQFLPEGNIMRSQVLTQLTSAQLARDQALATYNWLTGKPTDADVSQADAKLAVAKAQLDDAQREWDRLKNGPDPKDIASAQVRIDAIKATINLSHLTAPFSGTVTDLNMKPGDLVSAAAQASALATPLSLRLDDLSHILVDVQVTEVDINRIQIGQPVTMTFDAILGKTYNGNVTQVARTGSTTQGVVNFLVTVEITDPDQDVRPGMTAAVNIVVDQLKDVMLVPNRAIRLNNGARQVYLLKNGAVTPVEIKVGATSDTNSQVLSGDIQPGDDIILNPPLVFNQNGPPGFMQR